MFRFLRGLARERQEKLFLVSIGFDRCLDSGYFSEVMRVKRLSLLGSMLALGLLSGCEPISFAPATEGDQEQDSDPEGSEQAQEDEEAGSSEDAGGPDTENSGAKEGKPKKKPKKKAKKKPKKKSDKPEPKEDEPKEPGDKPTDPEETPKEDPGEEPKEKPKEDPGEGKDPKEKPKKKKKKYPDPEIEKGVVPKSLPVGDFDEIHADKPRDPDPEATHDDLQLARKASADLGFDLLRSLSKKNDKNVMVAPASLYAGLGQILGAARAETKEELMARMAPGLKSDALHRAISRLEMQSTANQKEKNSYRGRLDLRHINRVFVPEGSSPKPEYLELLATRYGTGVYGVDFQSELADSRKGMNAWTNQQTQTRVDTLFPEGSIAKESVVSLASALDLKAPWEKCIFCRSKKRDRTFVLHSGEEISTPFMMGHSWDTHSGVEEDFRWGAFYMGDGGLSYYMILPNEGRFEAVAAELSADSFRRWRRKGERCSLTINTPLFNLQGPSVDLAPHLQEMGIKRLFGQGGAAQLDGLGAGGQGEQSKLDSLMHQVSFGLDTGGLEKGEGPTEIPDQLPDIELPHCERLELNRPFFVVVYDYRAQQVLLVGRVMNPGK